MSMIWNRLEPNLQWDVPMPEPSMSLAQFLEKLEEKQYLWQNITNKYSEGKKARNCSSNLHIRRPIRRTIRSPDTSQTVTPTECRAVSWEYTAAKLKSSTDSRRTSHGRTKHRGNRIV
ncbi:uncharacterized protein BJX67DRAFT_80274 [Aspergillus lucknowensis]|uniref:MADF domain-containing protein n=1 Tax=Aspergillus lucknowensis TaxID=176173 RepID=A0ABR4LTZ7_9EURO